MFIRRINGHISLSKHSYSFSAYTENRNVIGYILVMIIIVITAKQVVISGSSMVIITTIIRNQSVKESSIYSFSISSYN